MDTSSLALSRRGLLAAFAAIAGACACPAHAFGEGEGCTLTASAAGTFASQVQLLRSSGVQLIDQITPGEINILVQAFGVSPSFAFFDDSHSPNAFATNRPIAGPSPFGSVAFGVNLLRSELNQQWWGAAVAGILAHEWGHIKQLRRLPNPGTQWGPVYKRELQADYLAGWYLGRKQMAGTHVVIDGLGQSLFHKGGYDFNNPDHHGTPEQRVNAMLAGYREAPQLPSADHAYDRACQIMGIPG